MIDPFIAIGEEDLGDPVGERIQCPHCGKTHSIEYGTRVNRDGTREPSKLLGVYVCGGKTYLCAINGRAIKCRTKSPG